MSKPKKWTVEEMERAELIWGPEKLKADTYRLHLPSNTEGVPGKMLDIPGYFVGDPEMVIVRQKAAKVILARIMSGEKPGRG